KNVHPERNEIVHRSANMNGTARSAENRPAMLMNAINKRGSDLHGLDSAFRIESAVPSAETQHFSHAIAIVQLKKERANNIVESRTQSAARHHGGACFLRVEK